MGVAAHGAGAMMVVSSYPMALGLLTSPGELGADVVMESLTKMIGGHSDVTLGFLAGTAPDLRATLTQVVGSNFAKVMAWYDNETGFAHRMVDLAKMVAGRL